MSRFVLGATAVGAILSGLAVTQAGAADLPCCAPRHAHRHVLMRHGPPDVVYGRADLLARRPGYNYEDNGAYDGPDVSPRGQRASWLDGYGTRPATYPGYGTYDTYGGSSQVWPRAITPAGGLAVYIPGAYGPGPRIIHIPSAD